MTFYAHYDLDTGKLLAVGGHKLPDEFPQAGIVEIDEELALKFMKLELNMSSWGYGQLQDGDMGFNKDLGRFVPQNVGNIVEISTTPLAHNMGLEIRLWPAVGVVEFMIPGDLIGKRLPHLEGETLNFVMTKKNDPMVVYGEFGVNIDDLFAQGAQECMCDFPSMDFSVFGERRFNFTHFSVMTGPRVAKRRANEGRVNNLTMFKSGLTEKGIQATYEENERLLTLEVLGNSTLSWPMPSNDCLLFLTKPHDANIIYQVMIVNIDTFLNSRKVTLQLPEELSQEFGLACYPLAPQMAFTRVNNDNTSNN